jgi:hypothetical protein
MGQRLYYATLGRFLATDPVPGGSANNYDYVDQDPVNGTDQPGNTAGHSLSYWYELFDGGFQAAGGNYRTLVVSAWTSSLSWTPPPRFAGRR